MRTWCTLVVTRAGDFWGGLGWLLFLLYLVAPLTATPLVFLWPALLILALLWIFADALDQGLPQWVPAAATVLGIAGAAVLPTAGLIYYLAVNAILFCIYWFHARE